MFPSQCFHRNIATLAMPLFHPTSHFSSVANVFTLNPFSLHNHDGPSPSCCICYYAYGLATTENEAEYPTQLVCGHVFWTKCIRQCGRTNSTCPLCRAELIEAKHCFFKIHALQVDEDLGLFETPLAHDLSYSDELGGYCTDGTEYFSSRSHAGSSNNCESEDDGFSWQEDAGSTTSGESGDECISPDEVVEQATAAESEDEDENFSWQEDAASSTDDESEDEHFSSPENTSDDSDDEYFNCRGHVESDTDTFFDAQEEFDMPKVLPYVPDEDIWLTAMYKQQYVPAIPSFSLLDVEATSIFVDNFFDDLVNYHSQWMTERLVCDDSDDECEVGFYDVYPY
jgi:hypothetical protein